MYKVHFTYHVIFQRIHVQRISAPQSSDIVKAAGDDAIRYVVLSNIKYALYCVLQAILYVTYKYVCIKRTCYRNEKHSSCLS